MPRPLPANHRRLALCFDGTWNTMDSHTNVLRLYQAIASADSNCPDQHRFYDPGVGTRWRDKVLGGAIGYGLDRNILEGYCWLVNNLDRDRAARGKAPSYLAAAEFASAQAEPRWP